MKNLNKHYHVEITPNAGWQTIIPAVTLRSAYEVMHKERATWQNPRQGDIYISGPWALPDDFQSHNASCKLVW